MKWQIRYFQCRENSGGPLLQLVEQNAVGRQRKLGLISRHCDEWKYIIIGRIFESKIILIPPSLKISESSSMGAIVIRTRYDEGTESAEVATSVIEIEVIRSSGEEMWHVDAYQIPYYSRGIEGEKRTHPRFADCILWNSLVLKTT
jgi:hypothetical protein